MTLDIVSAFFQVGEGNDGFSTAKLPEVPLGDGLFSTPASSEKNRLRDDQFKITQSDADVATFVAFVVGQRAQELRQSRHKLSHSSYTAERLGNGYWGPTLIKARAAGNAELPRRCDERVNASPEMVRA